MTFFFFFCKSALHCRHLNRGRTPSLRANVVLVPPESIIHPTARTHVRIPYPMLIFPFFRSLDRFEDRHSGSASVSAPANTLLATNPASIEGTDAVITNESARTIISSATLLRVNTPHGSLAYLPPPPQPLAQSPWLQLMHYLSAHSGVSVRTCTLCVLDIDIYGVTDWSFDLVHLLASEALLDRMIYIR